MRGANMFAVLVIFLLCTLSCADYSGEIDETLTIFTWNVQNLFDDVDDGSEYSEYTSDGGWTSSLYRTKLERMVSVLESGVISNADIAVLTEVETEKAANDLLKMCNRTGFPFEYYCFCRGEEQSTGTAILSRIPIISSFVHGTGDSQRPVLEADFNTKWGKISLLAVHLKAKENGEGYENQRIISASMLKTTAQQRLDEGYDTVVIAGDFNEQYQDLNTMGPDGSYILPVSGNRDTQMWYSQWLDGSIGISPHGSYMYNSQWQTIDNILIRKGTGLWDVQDAGVITDGIMTNADGSPNAYSRKLLTGVSDHLPVWVRLI